VGVSYRAVGWNRQKRRYDAAIAAGVALALGGFVGTSALLRPDLTAETLLIRALGAVAVGLLHLILCIGPLARLDRRFLPLLYNRRHLGVSLFLVALAHGLFALLQHHGFGVVGPLVSLFSGGGSATPADWPFQPLGAAALFLLFALAATSHDFWLANLTPAVWKTLHCSVYLAYALVVAHVLLGTLWVERDPWLAAALGAGLATVLGLHLLAGWREARLDRPSGPRDGEGWVDVAAVGELRPGRGLVRTVGGERVALFRDGERLFALSNLCRHQNGPLGEGRLIDGCVTCPWHGYQYRLTDGCAPPPFTERLATYRVRVNRGLVEVDPQALPPGTPASIRIPADKN
jgi:sulfoxide reductase heme-binding subunit YedZ